MKYFKQTKPVLKKAVSSAVRKNIKPWQKTHPWAKDALTRLEEYAVNGKMIRGLLVLLAAGAQSKRQAMPVAVSMELMHSGILIHDDIMDRDTHRRGLKTIHVQYDALGGSKTPAERLHYGESMAGCVGIVAYFLAMEEFSTVRNNHKLLKLFGDEMAVLGLGQMEDVDTATHDSHLTEEATLRIYEQKTGRYTFALPLLAGLMIANKDTAVNRKKVFDLAHYLGVIFQLRDDMLAIYGDQKVTGKSVGGDIRERKKTWLYFTALKVATKTDATKLKKLYAKGKQLTKAEQTWVLSVFKKYQIFELAEKNLLEYHAKASSRAAKLPFNKNQQQAMQDLLDYLVVRDK